MQEYSFHSPTTSIISNRLRSQRFSKHIFKYLKSFL